MEQLELPLTKYRKTRADLTFEERKVIEKGVKSHLSNLDIAASIKRTSTAISREVIRNGGRTLYTARDAQGRADEKKRARIGRRTQGLTATESNEIIRLQQEGYSHREISRLTGRSHSTVNNHIKKYKKEIPTRAYEDKALTLLTRVECIEMQLEILTDQLKEIMKCKS